jgi:rhamnulokinase
MGDRHFLAFDLGAESGRAFAAVLGDGRLGFEDILRFPNAPVEVEGTIYWDVPYLYENLLRGMREYRRLHGPTVDGIGIDTWAVDFGLFGHDGQLIENPVAYRDARTRGMAAEAAKRMPLDELYSHAGIMPLEIYTVFQMLALRLSESPLLEAAETFLMMPDLLANLLCGVQVCERTNAITTSLYDPHAGQWSDEVFAALDLPRGIMPELVDPGAVLGEVTDEIKAVTGLEEAPMIAPCTHDTGSAVAAVPARGDDWAFLSSGTWSIVGMLTDRPITTRAAYEAGLCNEATLGGFFLCRNITGLWLLQQARACSEREGRACSYAELVKMADEAPAGGPVVHPDDAAFLAPGDMVGAIGEFCERTEQNPPEDIAGVARCILESLALSHRRAVETIAEVVGRRPRVLHIVGGGSRNAVLCQMTADATGLPVVAGPSEATVIGNVLVQAYARGYLSSAEEIREVVRASTELVEYEPRPGGVWDERYGLYLRVLEEGRA